MGRSSKIELLIKGSCRKIRYAKRLPAFPRTLPKNRSSFVSGVFLMSKLCAQDCEILEATTYLSPAHTRRKMQRGETDSNEAKSNRLKEK